MIQFQAPITAGTVLTRSAIQSPNYAHGSAGWIVSQDGSAELNNLTVRGTFLGTSVIMNSAGAFFYNGAPASGNLIGSLAATAGTDAYGNAYGALFNVGNQQGSHFGIDTQGNLYLSNASNQSVVIFSPQKEAMWVYSGTPALGNLIVSVAGAAGTDWQGNAYPQGVHVTAGSISGTSISGGTVSGTAISGSTFTGTNWVQNAAGTFEYSGAPAAGNLVVSLTNASGTDAYGNHYVAGLTSYNNAQGSFCNIFGGTVQVGAIVAGVPDTTHAGGLFSNPGTAGATIVNSGYSATLPDEAKITLLPGLGSAASGSITNPSISIADSAGTSAVDTYITGGIGKEDLNGNPYQWQTPSGGGAANWSASLSYKLDAIDRVAFMGSMTYVGTAITGASIFSNVLANALVAPYLPKATRYFPLVHMTSGGVVKNTSAVGRLTSAGSLSIQWGDGVTGSAHDASGLANGDVFWFDDVAVPIGQM